MELGKVLASEILPALKEEDVPLTNHDPSTAALIQRIKSVRHD
ncbi:MAG: hypothetical protein AAFY32_12520 [Pseudomonadota bacterium]